MPVAVHLGWTCHPACPSDRLDARSRGNLLTAVSSSRRWRDVVSAASDPTVASRAGADRLLRTEPQVRLMNLFSYRTITGTSSLFHTQALPLVATRILRPRMSRGVGAEQPRNIIGSRPRQQPIREPDLAKHRARPRAVHVLDQSAIAFCPRPQTRQVTVFGHGQASASDIREQAAAAARTQPPSVHDLGRSVPSTTLQPRTVHGSQLATARTSQRIRVSASPPTQFPVHIHFTPAYGLI